MVEQDPYAATESGTSTVEIVHRLRLWPAWLIAAAQMVALVLTVTPSIRNLPRFIFMMAGPLVAASLFSIWMLLASKLRWREKLAISIAGIALPGVAVWICAPDDAMRTVLWIYGVPLAVFMITSALTIWSRSPQRTLLSIVFLSIGWASFAFVRNEGFDGDYFAEFKWR